jgi:hypothetical protein
MGCSGRVHGPPSASGGKDGTVRGGRFTDPPSANSGKDGTVRAGRFTDPVRAPLAEGVAGRVSAGLGGFLGSVEEREGFPRTLRAQFFACLGEIGRAAARSLGTCFGLYNRERLHESLGYRVPEEAHFGKSARRAPEFSCAARSLAVG